MSVHDRPHMVYKGSRPRHLPTPAFDVDNAGARFDPTDIAGERMRYDAKLAIALSVAGALGLGMGIGVWMSPLLGDSNPFLAPRAETAPLAMSVILPSTTAPATPDVAPAAVESLPEEPAISEAAAAPAIPEPTARAADPPRRVKVAAVRAKAPTPTRTAGGCSPDGSRAKVTLCADPGIAAADHDMERAFQRALRSGAPVKVLRADQDAWLNLREKAARRSPGDLAEAYAQRVSDLNALADDPPH